MIKKRNARLLAERHAAWKKIKDQKKSKRNMATSKKRKKNLLACLRHPTSAKKGGDGLTSNDVSESG